MLHRELICNQLGQYKEQVVQTNRCGLMSRIQQSQPTSDPLIASTLVDTALPRSFSVSDDATAIRSVPFVEIYPQAGESTSAISVATGDIHLASLHDDLGILHMPTISLDDLMLHDMLPGGPISEPRASETPVFSGLSRVTRQVVADVNPCVKIRSTVAQSHASESVTPGLQSNSSNSKRTFKRKNQIVLVGNNKTGRKGMPRCGSCRKVHLKVESHRSNPNSSANLMKPLEVVTIASRAA